VREGLLAVTLLWVSGCEETTPAAPGTFLLGLPADGAIVPAPSFVWAPALGATHYVLEVDGEDARDVGGTTAQLAVPAGETRGWRVTAVGLGGSVLAANAPFHFTVAPDAPGAFTLVSPAADAMGVQLQPTFRWTASTGAARYVLQAGLDASLSPPTFELGSLPPTTTSVVLDARLAPGTRWYWRVLAVDSVQTTATPTQAFTTAQVPGDFAVVSPANGASDVPLTPTFSWSASAGADGYTFELDGASMELNATTFVPAAPLGSGALHSWRVVAHNAQGTREISAKFTAAIAPAGFTLLSPPHGEIELPLTPTLSWSPSAAATTYSVQLGTTLAFDLPPVFEDDSVSGTSVAVTVPLTPWTTYYWRVVALNAAASVVASGAPFSFTTAPLPTAPVLYGPLDGATDVIVVASFGWTPPMFATSQTLEIASDSAFTNVVYRDATVDANYGGATMHGSALEGSTTYWWRVIANTPAGGTVASNAPWSFTTGVLPSPFTQLAPFTWTASANAGNYEVQVSTDPTFSGELYDDVRLASTATSYTPTATCPMAPSTTYYWRVWATGPAGITMASNAPQTYVSPPTGGGGGAIWAKVHTANTLPIAGPAFAVDATGVYDAVAAGSLWYVEKRSPVDGTLLWDSFTALTNPAPVTIILGATDLWVVSDRVSGNFRIEKRDLATGELVQGFGTGGIVTSTVVSNDPQGVATSDGTLLYLIGAAAGGFALERIALDTGASSGVVTANDSTMAVNTGASLVPPFLYVLGRNSAVDASGNPLDTQWHVEVRDPTDGGLANAFDVNPSAANDDPAVLLAGPDGLYLTGDDRAVGQAEWHVEKRDFDGGLLFSVSSDPSSLTDKVVAAALDGPSLYAVGSSNLIKRWRIEAYDSTTGAHVPTWGVNGVVECRGPATRDTASGVAVDATGVYVLGVQSDTTTTGFRWRVEKRHR
jgi:hypothetical protein